MYNGNGLLRSMVRHIYVVCSQKPFGCDFGFSSIPNPRFLCWSPLFPWLCSFSKLCSLILSDNYIFLVLFFALASKDYTANHFLRKRLLHWQHSWRDFHANLAFLNVAEFMRPTWGNVPWSAIAPGRKLESRGGRGRKQTRHVCPPKAYTFGSLNPAE